MGITKQYLRWIPGEKFGVIGSPCHQGIQLIHQWPEMISKDRICATAACDDIIFWDLKTCQQIERFTNDDESEKNSMISCLAFNDKSMVICSGHHNGCIRVYDCQENCQRRLKVVFSGHRGCVQCIAFDPYGLRIASGGKDTEIVVWDVVNQSGLFRLKGHKGPVNKVEFMQQHSWILISASSDTFIKLWNLETQHCFRTIVGHRTEVWSFVLLRDDTEIISGGSDSELKVWKLTFDENDRENFQRKSAELQAKRLKRLQLLGNNDNDDDIEEADDDNFILIENFGTILRKSMEKVTNIYVDQTENLLICHGKDNFYELFKLRSNEEIAVKMKKRIRKEKKRRREEEEEELEENEDLEIKETNENIVLSDEIERLDTIKTVGKICSIDIRFVRSIDSDEQEYRLALLLSNNQIEYQQIILLNKLQKIKQSKQISIINQIGHRNDIRTVTISSDSQSILTASSDSIKLWNKSSCRCINTINNNDNEYPLCMIFVPGNKHAILGTKMGKIQIICLQTAQIQSTIDANDNNDDNSHGHGRPIWSLNLLPDLTGIVTGSEDKQVKFWSFNLIIDNDNDDQEQQQQPQQSNRILTINHERTLSVEEGVICTKIAPNSKFIAVAMLNSCVKIYFCDTHKFFLSLYGHKLPVLCMDISSDNRLIVTGSSDKNIKIWGMDFGDCHRSLFAHDDNILGVQFLPKTHQFFTTSKDHRIKMWDADTFEKITTLEGHYGEIWSMAIAPNGKYMVTVSHDKSIRFWEKTNEPLILEEEKELENEKEFNKEFESHTIVPGESITTSNSEQESGRAQKKTIDTVRSIERLIESIDIYLEEIEKLNHYQQQLKQYENRTKKDDNDGKKPPTRESCNPNMMIYQTECPYRFMLEILKRIPSNEIEETLLQLPFYYIQKLLEILSKLLERRWEIELISRCCCYLIRVNFGQIQSSSSTTMITLIDQIRIQMQQALESIEELAAVNNVGLKYFENIFEQRQNVSSLFTEILYENRLKMNNKSNKKHKNKRDQQTAPILTWN